MPGLITHSLARRSLEQLGYSMVAFETGYYWTQVEDPGAYISPKSSVASLLDISSGLNSFKALPIRASARLVLVDRVTSIFNTYFLRATTNSWKISATSPRISTPIS
jgi:hypothetical protein